MPSELEQLRATLKAEQEKSELLELRAALKAETAKAQALDAPSEADELRAQLAQKKPRGGRGTSHVWRALTTNAGVNLDGTPAAAIVVSGSAVAPALADIYDAADPRCCVATARRTPCSRTTGPQAGSLDVDFPTSL